MVLLGSVTFSVLVVVLWFFFEIVDFNGFIISLYVGENIDNMTHIPSHLMISTHLIQWLAYRSACTDGSVCKKRDNVIHFNKDIVEMTFGFADGTIPCTMGRLVLRR
jgi:hypothetical protein